MVHDTNVKPINEFDKNGKARAFSYFNIHSFDYLKDNIKKINPKSKVSFVKDNFLISKELIVVVKQRKGL